MYSKDKHKATSNLQENQCKDWKTNTATIGTAASSQEAYWKTCDLQWLTSTLYINIQNHKFA